MSHLEQSVRRKAGGERTGHWFRAISESEPDETYLKTAAADLSRTCEATECQQSDSDETLFIHNLQSVADYVRASQVSTVAVSCRIQCTHGSAFCMGIYSVGVCTSS